MGAGLCQAAIGDRFLRQSVLGVEIFFKTSLVVSIVPATRIRPTNA